MLFSHILSSTSVALHSCLHTEDSGRGMPRNAMDRHPLFEKSHLKFTYSIFHLVGGICFLDIQFLVSGYKQTHHWYV